MENGIMNANSNVQQDKMGNISMMQLRYGPRDGPALGGDCRREFGVWERCP
jgi:hypothetical protein